MLINASCRILCAIAVWAPWKGLTANLSFIALYQLAFLFFSCLPSGHRSHCPEREQCLYNVMFQHLTHNPKGGRAVCGGLRGQRDDERQKNEKWTQEPFTGKTTTTYGHDMKPPSTVSMFHCPTEGLSASYSHAVQLVPLTGVCYFTHSTLHFQC